MVAGVAIAVATATAGLLIAKRSTWGTQPVAVVSSEPRKPASAPEPTDGRPSVESLWVTLSAIPGDAEIRLDGRRVSNPYRAAHGRDAVAHHITVSLKGYHTLEREVWFAHDVELRFSLDAASSSETREQKPKTAAARRTAVDVNAPIANPTAPASPAPPAGEPKPTESKPVEPKPGDDLRGLDPRTIKARGIDETDPYKR
jgi:hypothetical protein